MEVTRTEARTIQDQLLPGPAAVEAITGQRPHYSTYFRWTQSGVITPSGRIKLGFTKAGAKRLTTIAAVREFFRQTTAASAGGATGNRESGQRRSAISRAEQELAEAGF